MARAGGGRITGTGSSGHEEESPSAVAQTFCLLRGVGAACYLLRVWAAWRTRNGIRDATRRRCAFLYRCYLPPSCYLPR